MEQALGHSFEVHDIPGKGKGVVALRRIYRGEVILSEPPIFTLQREALSGPNNSDSSAAAILSALSTCTAGERAQFYALSHSSSVCGNMPVECGIFETNVLPCGPNDEKSGHAAARGGIFLLGSRFNSSCVPNVNNNWDEETGNLVFRAVKDVAAGEELCIAYGDALASREDRRAELQTKYGFVCQCEVCLLEGNALKESDYRRTCLNEMYREHVRGLSGDPMEILGEVMLALKYLREEGLVAYGSVFYRTGFTFCAAVSDFTSAKAWARKAHQLWCIVFGENKAEQWRLLVLNPKACAQAGSFSRRTLAGPDAVTWSYLGLR